MVDVVSFPSKKSEAGVLKISRRSVILGKTFDGGRKFVCACCAGAQAGIDI